MAFVNIWDNTALTGHASIMIANSIKDRYVSFHPNFSNNTSLLPEQVIAFNRKHHKNFAEIAMHKYEPLYTSFNQDQMQYGQPVNMIEIKWLDEDLVYSYLNDGFNEDHSKYNLLTCNCSTAVAALLFLGIHEYLTDATFLRTMATRIKHMNALMYKDADQETKNYHHRRYEQLADLFEKIQPVAIALARRAINPRLMIIDAVTEGLDLIRRAFCWSPGDVLHLALYLRDHPKNLSR